MPLHRGHEYLLRFAAHYVDDLHIVVGTLPDEPIPGDLRWQWVKSLFPENQVHHLADVLPQNPSEHPDFWGIWRKALKKIIPQKIDYVFASEEYGKRLAAEMDAIFVPVDQNRQGIKISATRIRENPLLHWDYLSERVKPYFVKSVCIMGPESTGKTTLAKDLAEHFKTVCVPEYAREWLRENNNICSHKDFSFIARGQRASENSLRQQARGILFCDTDPLVTEIWNRFLFPHEKHEDEVVRFAESSNHDLYLLTKPDIPWQADAQRYLPNAGEKFFEECERVLKNKNKKYAIISGKNGERLVNAIRAVEDFFALSFSLKNAPP